MDDFQQDLLNLLLTWEREYIDGSSFTNPGQPNKKDIAWDDTDPQIEFPIPFKLSKLPKNRKTYIQEWIREESRARGDDTLVPRTKQFLEISLFPPFDALHKLEALSPKIPKHLSPMLASAGLMSYNDIRYFKDPKTLKKYADPHLAVRTMRMIKDLHLAYERYLDREERSKQLNPKRIRDEARAMVDLSQTFLETYNKFTIQSYHFQSTVEDLISLSGLEPIMGELYLGDKNYHDTLVALHNSSALCNLTLKTIPIENELNQLVLMLRQALAGIPSQGRSPDSPRVYLARELYQILLHYHCLGYSFDIALEHLSSQIQKFYEREDVFRLEELAAPEEIVEQNPIWVFLEEGLKIIHPKIHNKTLLRIIHKAIDFHAPRDFIKNKKAEE